MTSRVPRILSARKLPLVLLTLLLGLVSTSRASNLLDGVPPRISNTNPDAGGGFEETSPGTWRMQPPLAGKGGWDLRVIYAVPGALTKGTGLVFECELRAVPGEKENQAGQAGILLDVTSGAPDAKDRQPVFRHILLAGPDWETFQIPITSEIDAPAGQWQLALVPEHFEQAVELRGLRLRALAPGENPLPSSIYAGQEPGAPWREKARQQIAKYRMGDFSVRVVDRLGSPVPGAKVTIEQTRHAYRFGTCVTASRLTDAEVPFRDPAMTREQFLRDNARYREEFLRLFNFAVFENDLKWPFWSGEKPRDFRQETTLGALEWLRDHHIPIKGHTLVWASWRQTPAWLKELENDKPALQAAILRHIRDVAAATAPFTSFWDVLNEPMSHRDILELLGHEAVAEWFRTAREALPGQKLVLNDFDLVGNGGNAKRRRGIIALVKDLKTFGGAPDILGFQSHFWSDRLTPPEQIWKILDEMHAGTGLPLAATEFDINFPNDRVQADYTRDFLTAWFAHPATESFIMWGFWGGAHWFGERGAMFREDWTPKPNLEAYKNLVFKEWWTNATGVTDAGGRFTTRAFLGDYNLRVEAPGYQPALRRPTLGKDGSSLEIVLGRPPLEP